MWTRFREKSLIVYVTVTTSLMLSVLLSIDLVFDLLFFEELPELRNYLWWDIPINLILSILGHVTKEMLEEFS
jgi:hypothetical protein